MKVPSLEDMIQNQINGDCICEECHCFLTEHYLVPNPYEILVCCYLDNTDLTFKPPSQDLNFGQLIDTLRTMIAPKAGSPSTKNRFIRLPAGVLLTGSGLFVI